MEWRVLGLLVVLTLLYLSLGGLVFNSLEGEHELMTMDGTKAFIRMFTSNNSCVTEVEINSLLEHLVTASSTGMDILAISGSGATHWDIPNAIFFSCSVITTVGYGMLAPATEGGKLFCCLYALIGIPIFYLLMHSFGEKIFLLLSRLASKVTLRLRCHWLERVLGSLLVLALGCGLILLAPAAVFAIMEGWDFTTAIYYTLTSVSTIGFGDYVAGEKMVNGPRRSWYRVAVMVWLFLGVAWWAGCLNATLNRAVNGLEQGTERFNQNTKRVQERISKKLRRRGCPGSHSSASAILTVSEDYTVIHARHGISHDYTYCWTRDQAFPMENVNDASYSTYL